MPWKDEIKKGSRRHPFSLKQFKRNDGFIAIGVSVESNQ